MARDLDNETLAVYNYRCAQNPYRRLCDPPTVLPARLPVEPPRDLPLFHNITVHFYLKLYIIDVPIYIGIYVIFGYVITVHCTFTIQLTRKKYFWSHQSVCCPNSKAYINF